MRSPATVRAGLLAALVVAAIAFVAPASHAQTTTTTPAVNPCPTDKGYAVVKLQNTAYNPATVALPAAGGNVCFEHDDGATPHSVTFLPPTRGDIDSNPDCSPSNTGACFHQGDAPFVVQLTTNGVYKYHCKIHEQMQGTITVGNGVPPASTTTTAKPTGTTTPNNTPTTVGSIATQTTTTAAATTTSEATTTTLPLTTQTTSSALAKSSSNNDKPGAVLKAIGIVLLAAVVAALIPSWRRLT